MIGEVDGVSRCLWNFALTSEPAMHDLSWALGSGVFLNPPGSKVSSHGRAGYMKIAAMSYRWCLHR